MEMIRDFASDLKITQSLVTATKTADANCTGVSMVGYSSVAFIVTMGDSGDTLSGSVKWELEIEESDDNSTYTDAPNASVRNYVTGTNTGTFAVIDAPSEDSTVFIGQYTGTKKYCRCVLNSTGTHTNGTPIGVIAIRSGANVLPVA